MGLDVNCNPYMYQPVGESALVMSFDGGDALYVPQFPLDPRHDMNEHWMLFVERQQVYNKYVFLMFCLMMTDTGHPFFSNTYLQQTCYSKS
jgi:hypothetical protein